MRTTIAMTVVMIFSTANAEELSPKDYSPSDTAAIRTLSIKQEGKYRNILVAIANRSDAPFNANFSCTLIDQAGGVFDTVSGSANAVPPGQEIVAKTTSFQQTAKSAACRIEFTIPSK